MLNKKDLTDLIVITRQHVKLSESVIEKDFYVTQLIHTLSNVENEFFRLVFCGGTCLAKAHKLVKRMSEDVDFKVVIKNGISFSRSQLIKQLKKFREQIKASLAIPELTIIEDIARNEGSYQRILIKYPTSFSLNPALRPDIMLEFTRSNIRLPIESLQINTLIEDTLKEIKIFTPPHTHCVSIQETAVEKWVGLTRRVMAIERGYEVDDQTLVRHIYDLNAINQVEKIDSHLIELVKTIIHGDGEQFKNQHPEYAVNPNIEIQKSLILLKGSLWEQRYQDFITNMVYDSNHTLNYTDAIHNLDLMSSKFISS